MIRTGATEHETENVIHDTAVGFSYGDDLTNNHLSDKNEHCLCGVCETNPQITAVETAQMPQQRQYLGKKMPVAHFAPSFLHHSCENHIYALLSTGWRSMSDVLFKGNYVSHALVLHSFWMRRENWCQAQLLFPWTVQGDKRDSAFPVAFFVSLSCHSQHPSKRA